MSEIFEVSNNSYDALKPLHDYIEELEGAIASDGKKEIIDMREFLKDQDLITRYLMWKKCK